MTHSTAEQDPVATLRASLKVVDELDEDNVVPISRKLSDSSISESSEDETWNSSCSSTDEDEDEVENTFLVNVNLAATKDRNNNSKCVSFTQVFVREYQLTVGDHPLTDMYPLSLDWSHTETEQISVEDHLALREEKLQKREAIYKEIEENNKWKKKHQLPHPFKLDTQARVNRLYNVSGLRPGELYNMEKLRHERIRENLRRAAIGLPPIDS